MQCQVVGLDPGPGSTLRFSVEIQLEEWGFREAGKMLIGGKYDSCMVSGKFSLDLT